MRILSNTVENDYFIVPIGNKILTHLLLYAKAFLFYYTQSIQVLFDFLFTPLVNVPVSSPPIPH